MKICGIDFVSLNLPIKRHVETLSAGAMFFLFLGLLPFGWIFTIYILFFTKYWPYFCVYLLWIWVFDRNISETGGRPNEWVRTWTIFKWAAEYFPVKMMEEPGFKIDSKKNYISCTFPHGVMPLGSMLLLYPNAVERCNKLYPDHILHGMTLKSNFFVPFYREFLLASGLCSVTPRSIEHLLSRPEGGKVVSIVVGGAAESFYCQPGQYRLVLKNRKGFVKMALKNGAPLIPIFAFGQNDIFNQVIFSEGSILRRAQILLKKLTGIAPIIFNGRGLFQYNFGMIPLKKPINIIMGVPIEVKKIVNPTQEDVDTLHSKFVAKITEIYEKYKYQFIENPEDSCLIIS